MGPVVVILWSGCTCHLCDGAGERCSDYERERCYACLGTGLMEGDTHDRERAALDLMARRTFNRVAA